MHIVACFWRLGQVWSSSLQRQNIETGYSSVMWNAGNGPVSCGRSEPRLSQTLVRDQNCVMRNLGTRPVSCGTLESGLRHPELWNEACVKRNFGMRPVSCGTTESGLCHAEGRRPSYRRSWFGTRTASCGTNLKRRAQANIVDVLQYSTKKPQLGYEYLYYIKNHVQNVLVSHTYPLHTLTYKLVWDFKRALAHVVVI